MRLREKIAIITGGGTGIGRACALRFAQEGAKIVVAGLEPEPLAETAQEIIDAGGESLAIPCDLRIPGDTKRVVSETMKRFGALHILFNNAATVEFAKSIQDTTVEEWDSCMNASLRSAFLVSKWAGPEIRHSGGGAIINTGSVGGVMAWENGGAYCVAKGGIFQLTKVLAIEYGPWNIRVNTVSPGAILTHQLERVLERPGVRERLYSKSVFHRVGQPEEVASAAVFLASDEASFVTSANLFVDGGYLTL
jgi:NAD(P)-dependent dehydrogenase (short-subunit alcohol dehydrogenase family)